MRKISFSDYLDMVEEIPYVGFLTCWGGKPAKFDAGTVLSFMNGTLIYFESDEINGEQWKEKEHCLNEEFFRLKELDKIERQFTLYYY
jgi:hypothetical protein